MLFNIKLDTTSEYVCEEQKWPKPTCNVMIESLDMTAMAHMLFGTTPDEAYIDLYAYIEPARRLVTGFLIICKKGDGTQDEFEVGVTDIADSVEYYKTLEYQGGEEFKQFITSSLDRINSEKMGQLDCLIEIAEDMLNANGLRLPQSDKEMEENDALPYEVIWSGGRKQFATYKGAEEFRDALSANCGARIQANPGSAESLIYGTDYSNLSDAYENYLGVTSGQIDKDRLNALSAWASKYNPDELDFYTELANEFSIEQIEVVCGKEAAEHIRAYWDEHGLGETA